jgi:hypothetical protein
MTVNAVVTCDFPIKEKVQDPGISGEAMCTVFRDTKGVILRDFLESG